MKVLMVGVDETTKGGMWTVAANYLRDKDFCEKTSLKYIATSITGSKLKRVVFTARALASILFELLTKKYDIVHIHMSERGSVYRKNIVVNLAKHFKCKVVLHMHGAEFEKWYKESEESRKRFIRKVVDKADSILILGVYWKEFIQTLVEDKSKVEVVYNAVAVPEENKYNSAAKNLLFLGVVGQRKGVYDLLDAMKQIEHKLSGETKLWIYGPDFENVIHEKIKELSLEERVEYKGWLTQEKKAEVLNEIAVNILPSYNEGLPMTILETMSFGIPNITTNVAAIPEAVNEDNGIIITPGDVNVLAESILRMMNDKEERINRSRQSYQDAKEFFSISGHIEKILKIYDKLG